jgi:hypothetical protein
MAALGRHYKAAAIVAGAEEMDQEAAVSFLE